MVDAGCTFVARAHTLVWRLIYRRSLLVVRLVGWSYGGFVVSDDVARIADTVASVVLFGSFMSCFPSTKCSARPSMSPSK